MPLLRLLPSEKTVEVKKGALLIDAIREAGMPIGRACGDDLVCAGCGVRILEGRTTREAPVETRAKERNRIDPELRLACAMRIHDDMTVTADYW